MKDEVNKMRKVSLVVIHENYHRIVSVNARTFSGEVFSLVYRDSLSHEYDSFNELYKSLLKIAKNNHLYIGFYESFGRKVYDIQFINVHNPALIEQFGLREQSEAPNKVYSF